MEPILRAENISSSRDGFEVRDVNLSIPEGKIVLITGRNGSGKTTLLETLICSIIPKSGTLTIDGRKVFDGSLNRKNRRKSMKEVGVLFQDDDLFDRLTVRETLETFLSLYTTSSKENGYLDDECPWLRSELDKRVNELSNGKRQLVKILLSFSHDPKLLFMDEPTVNLDEDTIEWTLEKIKRSKRRGVSFLIAVNELWDIGHIADDMYIIDQGMIIDHIPGFKEYYKGSVLTIGKDTSIEAMSGCLDIMHLKDEGDSKKVFISESRSDVFKAMNGMGIDVESVRRPKLSDFF